MHEIGAEEADESEEAGDAALGGMGHAQEHEGDEGDGDLNAHGVLGGSEEAADFEGVLDPAEEQFDLPAPFVEFGDVLGRASRSLVTMRRILPVSVRTRSSRTGAWKGFLRLPA